MSSSQPPDNGLRLDKWLWAARFFKTRSAATAAVNGGKVHVNGARVRPARAIRVGDRLWINRPDMEVVVDAISARRGPATEAQKLYSETDASREQRALAAEQRRQLNPDTPKTMGRPDKHQRRELRRLTGKS